MAHQSLAHHDLQRPPALVNISHIAYTQEEGRNASAKQIIDGINHAVNCAQRHQAVRIALHAFHHNNEHMHDYEFDMGATNALCLKLGYVLLQSARYHPCDLFGEISMICIAMLMVYGCSTQRTEQSFHEIGKSELFPLLVQIIGSVVASDEKEIQNAQNGAIYSALQLLRIFSKLDCAKHFMIDYDQNRLIHMLVQASGAPTGEKADTPISLEAISLIKDLSFRSNDSDKDRMFSKNGMVTMLMSHCSPPKCQDTVGEQTKHREYVSAILWNLALSREVSRKMTQSSEVLRILIMLTADDSKKTRRNAISALGNLATITENKDVLLAHDHFALVRALMEATEKDIDVDCRRRAMRTIRCIAVDKTSAILQQNNAFDDYLINITENDSDVATRIQACETMGHFTSEEEVSTKIIFSLIHVVESETDCKLILAACRALSRYTSTLLPKNTTETYSQEFLQSLERAATQSKDRDAHACLAKLFLKLEQNDSTRKQLTSESVLNALATLVSMEGPDFEQSRIDAVCIVTILVEIETNKRPMAQHDALLTALVNFALAAPEGKKKNEAKQVIMLLVTEL